MSEFINLIREASDGALNGVSDFVVAAMAIVCGLLVVVSIFAFVISAFLSIAYIRYNRKTNSCNRSGEEIARAVLDRNGLQNIRVTKTGSIMFGNSYSHYFKKIRLRRLTWKKHSVSSLAMAVQKSSLAILDKNGDKDMKARVKMTPLIYFGPLAFVPLVIIGAVLDLLVLNSQNGICTIVATSVGLLIYLVSFAMSVAVLKTEKKAQAMALEIMEANSIATQEELQMCKKLFRLYNIEYINDMVISLLELIYRVLQIISYVQGSSNSSSTN